MSLYKGNKLIANVSSLSDVESKIHYHENKEVLDKFSESDKGNILYNGEEINPDVLNIFSVLNIHTTEETLYGKVITITANNSVICNTKFDTEGNATAILYKVDKSENPEYTVTCEDVTETIVINNEGIYDVELSFLSSYINVTTNVEGSTVIAELMSQDGKEYKKEVAVDATGSAKIKVGAIGTYKVYSTYKTGISSSETIEITENNQTKDVTLNFATLVVTTTTEKYIGLNITIKSGDETITTFISTGNDIIYLPELKTYSLSAVGDTIYNINVSNYATYTKTIDEMGIGNSYKIVTFANGTEKEIIDMINAHYNDEINISDYWSVGDKRIIHVNEIPPSSTFEETTIDQDIEIRIIGIEHDNLVENINGHSKACITVECVPALYTFYIRSTRLTCYIEGKDKGNIQYRYDWLNNNFKEAIPTIIGNNVKQVIKSVQTSLDRTKAIDTNFYCFLLTSKELTGGYDLALIKSDQGEQYEYYTSVSNILADNYINTKEEQYAYKFLFSECDRPDDRYIVRCSGTTTGIGDGGMGGLGTYYYLMAPAFCL